MVVHIHNMFEFLKRKKKGIAKPILPVPNPAMLEVLSDDIQSIAENVEIQGYTSKEEQDMIYTSLLSCGINFETDTILDIGCGVGGLYEHLKNNLQWNKTEHYTGIDYNFSMVDIAKRKYNDVNFQCTDILKLENDIIYDWCIGINIFNLYPEYNEEIEKNIEVTVEKMYVLSKKGVVFNFVYQEAVIPLVEKLLKKYQKILFRSDYVSDDYCFYIYH